MAKRKTKCWYPSEQVSAMDPLYSACKAVASNKYELENDIVKVEELLSVMWSGPDEVWWTLNSQEQWMLLSLSIFLFGFEYMDKMLGVFLVASDLLEQSKT